MNEPLPSPGARTLHLLSLGLLLGVAVGVILCVVTTFVGAMSGLEGVARQAARLHAGFYTGQMFVVLDRVGMVLLGAAWLTGGWTWSTNRPGRGSLAFRVALLVLVSLSMGVLAFYLTPRIVGLLAEATPAPDDAARLAMDRLHPLATGLWYFNLISLLVLFLGEGLSRPVPGGASANPEVPPAPGPISPNASGELSSLPPGSADKQR
ncbi:MAG: hypothetical protein BIFFINMI_02128 [Phycisphaerae bacterium]|nr:hypothetical protein [Phycisphaerae bacterium]